MGGQHTRQQNLFNPSSAGFERVQNSSGTTIWLNELSGEEIEEYQFISNNERQFQYEIDAFNYRHNNPYLVSSLYLRQQVQSQICGSTYIGNLFLERIPRRLSELNEIPYPDVLHLYSQAFRGFDLIIKQVGPFNVTEDMIGINKSGIAKVWANSDFSRSLPDRSIEIMKISEQAMIQRIVEVIHQNTYLPSMRNNIRDFFQQRNPITLLQAHAVLEEYARLNNTQIPARLDCFLETFNQGLGTVVNTGTFGRNSVHPPIINPSVIGTRQVNQINQVGQLGLAQTQFVRPVTQQATTTYSQMVASPITHSVVPPATSSILAPSHSSVILAASPSSALIPSTVVSPSPIVPTSHSVVLGQPIIQQRPVTSVLPVAPQTTFSTVIQNNSRNILNQAKSLPISGIRSPTVGTTSHNIISNVHAPVNTYHAARSHLHVARQDQSNTSFVRAQNKTKPLFPKVSPVRHTSVAKPSTVVAAPRVSVTQSPVLLPQPVVSNGTQITNLNARNSNLATKVSPSHLGEVHHLFNRKTAGTNVLAKNPSHVNFNSTHINNLNNNGSLNTKQYQSVYTTTPKQLNFKPLSQIKAEEQVSNYNSYYKSNNNNTITQKTVTQKYDFSQKYNYKPFTSDNIITQTHYQTTGSSGLQGMSGRIQKLNDKYKNNPTGSLYVPPTTSLNYVPSTTATNYAPLTTQINYQTSAYSPINATNIGSYQTSNNKSSSYAAYTYDNNLKTVGGTSYPTFHPSYPLTTTPFVAGTNAYLTSQQPASFASIIKQQTRDIVYAPGETGQSFAVERFAPTINTINIGSSDLLSSFGRGQQNVNLASGYITSINDTLTSPYNITPIDARYATIREQLYENTAQPSRSYQYTSTYTESYHSNNYGITSPTSFESVYPTSVSGIPQGAAYLTGEITTPIAATYEKESYFREQQSSKFVSNNLEGYHVNLDSDIMSDLNRIRTSGTLG